MPEPDRSVDATKEQEPLQFRYRSKGFAQAWKRAVDGGVDFDVDVRTWLWKESIRRYVDSLFHGAPFRLNPLAILFCGELTICISVAFNSNSYRVDHSDPGEGLRLLFRRVRHSA